MGCINISGLFILFSLGFAKFFDDRVIQSDLSRFIKISDPILYNYNAKTRPREGAISTK